MAVISPGVRAIRGRRADGALRVSGLSSTALASVVFEVLATGFSVLLGLIISAFTSYAQSRRRPSAVAR
jgi:hypothetical protein